LSDRYALAESWIEANNFGNASDAISNVIADYMLDDIYIAEHDNFLDYLSFRENIFTQGKNILQLNSADISELQSIADLNKGFASAMAKNILCFGYGICTYTPPVGEGGSGSRIAYPRRNNSSANEVTVIPNPASTFATFHWDIPSLDGNAFLKITDLAGRPLLNQLISQKQGQFIWDTRKIENGVYLYQVIKEGRNIGLGKIIISNSK